MTHQRVGALLCTLCCLSGLAVAQGTNSLQPGQPVEREIAGGESQTYQLTLAAGQFVRFRLEQRALDATLILNAPDGKQPTEMNLIGPGGQEVLSGGSGANGKEVEGFGVLAQRQGAKAVIASLWPVFDTSTKFLMQGFYRLREAQAGTSKAEALRQAQLKLLRGEATTEVVTTKMTTPATTADRQIVHEEKPDSGNKPRFTVDPKKPYAHPYYWAPFILIGNWK